MKGDVGDELRRAAGSVAEILDLPAVAVFEVTQEHELAIPWLRHAADACFNVQARAAILDIIDAIEEGIQTSVKELRRLQ